ncbi:bifunctional methylenetetrahydrofolate dehydrogenase/methenyltetrahydrofolate cyclohydrolase FolD [Melioribacteraceae bacterium 4301-Me]|uniref:bifunctional methylenetetrahydrofolate dehydrogenase/methenyltetrahydrofolate cyclohydrolase FolD n=1 Tax=Pyranulibacter aquaticus TaxID=3163344 RepID=UPI0035978812
MAVIIDGKKVAAQVKAELKEKIEFLKIKYNKVPGLVTILVGNNPASLSYVNSKVKACREIGINSVFEKFDAAITQDELLSIIKKYNNDENFHGILVQLPLPEHLKEDVVIESINPLKDVDGFHPYNVGNLVIGKDTLYPCTPYGILELLFRYSINPSGKHVVVVGRSNIVGKPIANMLLQKKDGANAVVTICHSAAKDLTIYTKQADILIAAIGKPLFIKEDMVKEGAVVIDVGINRIEDNTTEKGYRIVGDVDFENVVNKASFITPVPGGVGLMTVAMLLKNTITAFEKIESLKN